MTSKPVVSVITPVHNGAPYIEECVRSVQNQTYPHWEYTIVDNASTDDTPAIAAPLIAGDARIRYMRFDDFVSVEESHNRAFGLMHPESEFCKVVQADDWLYPECLDRMVAAATASDTVALVSSYRLWGHEVDLVGLPYGVTFAPGHEVLRQSLLGGPYVTGGPTAVLYRSSVIRERDVFYQEDFPYHADTEAAYWILNRHDFGFVHQVLTYARRQPKTHGRVSVRLNTYAPENLRCLLRYGPLVLTADELSARLRFELREYVLFHARQVPKLSRLAQPDFFKVHSEEVQRILEEGPDRREVRTAMLAVKALLLRGGLNLRGSPEAELDS
jgi:glycosyltransferase involved in cell wall biosynthesis